MQERISEILKDIQFFEFGIVTFASNHPDHVYLLETQNENNEKFTILYDKKHDYLNINKHNEDSEDSEEQPIIDIMGEMSNDKKQQIKQLLIKSGNNVI